MKPRFLLLLVSFGSLFGCQYDPYTAVYTRAEPKAEDLPGRYVMTADTKKMVAERMNYPFGDSWIVLRPDGTFTLHDLPDCWATDFGEPKGKFDQGKGRWEVRKNQKWWAIGLMFDSAAGITSVKDWTLTITEKDGSVKKVNGKDRGYDTSPFLVGENPPYIIHFTVGDPDAGIGLQYQKSKAPNQPSEPTEGLRPSAAHL